MEKARKQIVPWSLWGIPALFNTYILAPGDQHWTSDLENCKIINLYFKPTKFMIICYSSSRKLIPGINQGEELSAKTEKCEHDLGAVIRPKGCYSE